MNCVFKIKPEFKNQFNEVLHKDETCRVQTVSNDSPLLSGQQKFMINTSFNHNKEPIIYQPNEAIRTFFGSGLDILIIGNYLVKKTNLIA